MTAAAPSFSLPPPPALPPPSGHRRFVPAAPVLVVVALAVVVLLAAADGDVGFSRLWSVAEDGGFDEKGVIRADGVGSGARSGAARMLAEGAGRKLGNLSAARVEDATDLFVSQGCQRCCGQSDCNLAYQNSEPGQCCHTQPAMCCPMYATCAANACHRSPQYGRRGHRGGGGGLSALLLLVLAVCCFCAFRHRQQGSGVAMMEPGPPGMGPYAGAPPGMGYGGYGGYPGYNGYGGYGGGGGFGAGSMLGGLGLGALLGYEMGANQEGWGGGYGGGGYGGGSYAGDQWLPADGGGGGSIAADGGSNGNDNF